MKKLVIYTIAASLIMAACSNEKQGATEINETKAVAEKSDSKTKEVEKSVATKEKNSTEENEKSVENQQSIENQQENNAQDQQKAQNVKKFSDDEKQAMVEAFYEWGKDRAEIGNMALSHEWFGHGAAGFGDWFADTPDGRVQVQDNERPGFNSFKIHAIGGVVFYTRKDGVTGAKDLDEPITAVGYSQEAHPDKDIHKYMLADNGKVYELILPYKSAGFSSGFGEYDDDGKFNGDAGISFEVSGDDAAQTKWQEILNAHL